MLMLRFLAETTLINLVMGYSDCYNLGRKVIEYKLEHLWNENNKRDLFRYI